MERAPERALRVARRLVGPVVAVLNQNGLRRAEIEQVAPDLHPFLLPTAVELDSIKAHRDDEVDVGGEARWVFADEATSALDEALEQAMYEKLLALVSVNNGALVSVAHRPSVAAFHNQQWLFEAAPADSAAKYVVTFSASSATNL